MPQFDFGYWPGQIVWLLIVFTAVYFALSRVFLPRIRETLEARGERIEAAMAEARRLRDEAEAQAQAARAEVAEAHARARATAAEARAKAAAEAQARQAALEAELNQKLTAAEDRIRSARDQAMSQVRTIAADTAAAIAEKLTGKAATPGEVVAALDEVAGRAGLAA